jgi:hypothetical protein
VLTLKIIPLAALALLVPVFTAGTVTAAQGDLPTPTSTAAVSEPHNPNRIVIAHDLSAPTSKALEASALGDNRNANLTAIRTGKHPAYDRVVFDFTGPSTGLRYVVSYQNGTLRVDLEHGALRNSAGTPTYPGPRTRHPNLAQLKTIRIATASTDSTTVLLSLRHPAGFRVTRLHSPNRIAVDIAH